MGNAQGVVGGFFLSLLAGDIDRAMCFVSPDFGISDGRDALSYVANEIAQIAGFPDWLKRALDRNVLVEEKGGGYSYSVFARDGRLAFESRIRFDEGGLIVGNQSQFEVVPKLSFSSAREPMRAVAVRSPVDTPSMIRVPGTSVVAEAKQGACFDDDGFLCARFLPDGDALDSRSFRIKVFGTEGSRSVEDVWFNGIDHPLFHDGLFPVVDYNRVAIDTSKGLIWSLSVKLASGMIVTRMFPGEAEHAFDEPVVYASITDALDNDWEIRI